MKSILPMVRDGEKEKLADKLAKLNEEAEQILAAEQLELQKKTIEKAFPEYYDAVGILARRWRGVREGAFDRLCDSEKRLLGDLLFPSARWLKVPFRLLHFTVPALAVFLFYEATFCNPFNRPPLIVFSIIFGLIGSLFVSCKIESSAVFRFLRYRKICFPESPPI